MSFIIENLKKEKIRIEYLYNKYNEEYILLPKGIISEKKVNDKIYYYLKYREGTKVVSKYIHKIELIKVQEQIEKRKHIEIMMKTLKNELKLLNEILEDYV